MSNHLSPRGFLALGALRLVNLLSRALRRGEGTVAGGRVGLAICPDLLKQLSKSREIVLISATNGKTTTTALTVAGWGASVATNATGANMPAGHTAALASSSSIRCVLETDEAWLPSVIESTDPRVVILMNLSRDQLDRAKEVRAIAQRWRAALSATENHPVVIANANDPLVVFAAEVSPNVTWCDIETSWTSDSVSCPKCTLSLHRDETSWSCSCGFAKPRCSLSVRGSEIRLGTTTLQSNLSIPGQFNIGNAAMALGALDVLKVSPGSAIEKMNAVTGVAGRFSVRTWKGRSIQMLLAKNPAGFDALLHSLRSGTEDVWVAINARIADGKDPSWLYDVSFENLRGRTVWCMGDRRLDLATRLEYANVEYRIVDDLNSLPTSQATVELLANYTAFSDWMERSSSR